LLVVTYVLTFNIVYIYIANNHLDFQWNIIKQFDGLSLFFFAIISLIPAFIFPLSPKKPSQLLLWLLYLVVFIPSCFVPLYSGFLDEVTLLTNILFLLIAVVLPILILNTFPYRLKLPITRFSSVFLMRILFIFIFISIVIIFLKFNKYLGLVSWHQLYAKRTMMYKVLKIDKGGTIFSHLIMWSSKCFLPFLLLYGISMKSKIYSIFAIISFLLLFALSPHKDILATLFITPVVYFWLQKTTPTKRIQYFIIFFITLLIISTLIAAIFGTRLPTQLIVDRLFVTPGYLTGSYMAFFARHPITYLSDLPLFGLFFNYPYAHTVPFEVGYFINHVYFNANANLWASAFAELGNLGMICASIFLTIYLWLYDSVANKWNNALPDTLIVLFAIDLFSNIPLQTALFSGGLLLYLVLLWILAPKNNMHSNDVDKQK